MAKFNNVDWGRRKENQFRMFGATSAYRHSISINARSEYKFWSHRLYVSPESHHYARFNLTRFDGQFFFNFTRKSFERINHIICDVKRRRQVATDRIYI